MQRSKILVVLVSLFLIIGCSQNPPAPKKLSKAEKSEVYRDLGIRYYQLGKLAIAKEKLTIALHIDPNNAQTHNALGVLYGRLNDKNTAKNHFDSAIALAPGDAKVKNNYGRFLCEQRKYPQAMNYLQSAAKDPTNQIQWQVFTNLGHCNLLQGNKQKATLFFKKALLQNPKHAPALLEMSKIYYAERKYMTARAFLERFFSASGKFQTAESLDLGYLIENALGDNIKAENYRNSLMRQFPGSPEVERILMQ
jgi:type IV pilus assembly protein PilF